MIRLHNVEKIYPPKQYALYPLDLKVAEGEFLFIAGASGAGKSTLLKLLFGAERTTSGEIIVAGRNLKVIDTEGVASLRRDMGVVFQDYKLLTRKTVIENVAFGLEVCGVSRRDREDMAMSLLEAIGLKERYKALPLTLSGGEQQRVAIARALIHKPRILLADEPTGNLDPEMSRLVFDLLLDANASGVTVLVATHNLTMIEELNLRTIVLDSGKIIGNFNLPEGAER